MSNEAEFSSIGFAPGVVRGARSFKVDSLGRLTGVNYPQVWKPGENAAECLKADDFGLYLNARKIIASAYTYIGIDPTTGYAPGGIQQSFAPTPPPAPKGAEEPHSLTNCSCGFYAYYDGSDDYHQRGFVSAVVEGYGETLIGTRGFRAMKARIVALHIPDEVPYGLANRVRNNYRDAAHLTSFHAMVAAFPPDSAGMEITPDTAPDFWDRKI